ncbi:MAG: O-antigen ligase family protein [Rhizobiales bacterium]|nr:O-antigen ligase family protein [Hyphomicrobiales bacterium]
MPTGTRTKETTAATSLLVVLYLALGPTWRALPGVPLGFPPALFIDAFTIFYLAVCAMRISNIRRPNPSQEARASQERLLIFLAVAFFIIQFLMILRGPGSITIVAKTRLATSFMTSFALLSMIFYIQNAKNGLERAVSLFLISLPIYLAINIALWALRLDAGSSLSGAIIYNVNTTLQLFGIYQARLSVLPSITSPNSIGAIAGISIVACIHYLQSHRRSLFAWALLGCGLYASIMSETRLSILATLICVALYLTSSRKTLYFVSTTLLLGGAFVSIFMPAIVSLLDSIGIGDIAVRDSSLGVATGRQFIWIAATQNIVSPDLILGYGYFGQVTSGLVNDFLFVFGEQNLTPSLHNTYLQYIYDSGYIGFILYVSLFFVTLRVLKTADIISDQLIRSIFACLLFILIMSFGEVVGTVYHPEIFYFLGGVLGLSVVLAKFRLKQAPAAFRERPVSARHEMRLPPLGYRS